MPTSQILRPASGCKGEHLLGDGVGRPGAGEGEHGLAHPPQPSGVGEEPLDLSSELEALLGEDDRAAASLEVGGVLSLVIGCRVRIGDEERRLAGGGNLPDGAAGPRDDEVGSRERCAEIVREGEEPVTRARDRLPQARIVALAAEMEDCGPIGGEGGDRGLVQGTRPLAPAEHEHHLPVGREAEAGARILPVDRERARRQRPPDDAVFRGLETVDGKGEKDAPREGRGEAVGEAEVRVGLGQHRGDPDETRRDHHRAGDVAAAAEDDLGAPPTQDLDTGKRGAGVDPERAEEIESRAPWQSRDVERLELEPGGGYESRLDAVRRPRERDCRPARAQRFRDRERRQHVAGGSAGGDQALRLARCGRHG